MTWSTLVGGVTMVPMARLTAIACAALITIAPFGLAAAHAEDTNDTTSTTISPDSTYVWDLENDPSECINFNPRPNCGKKPQQAGDRGGALQYTVFAVMLGGLAVVGTVLIRNVIKRDRALMEQVRDSEQQ